MRIDSARAHVRALSVWSAANWSAGHAALTASGTASQRARGSAPSTATTRQATTAASATPANANTSQSRDRPCCGWDVFAFRSEEHTSELQSRRELVCRLLLEKKKKREPH